MSEFFGSSDFLLPFFGFLKAFVVAMFGMNVGVVLTWVERRMRAMIQDSVGPNRANIPLPGKLAAVLAAAPALLVAGVVVGTAARYQRAVESHASWGLLFTHAAIFLLWLTTAAVARAVRARGPENAVERLILDLGTPRSIVLAGFGAHMFVAALNLMAQGTTWQYSLAHFWFWGGAVLLVFALLASSGHVAFGLSKEKLVRLRLIGLLHPAADGLKTAFKTDFEPKNGDRFLFNLAPWISFFPTMVVCAIVPFGPALCFGSDASGSINFGAFQGIESVGNVCSESRFSLQAADLNVGILYFFAMAGMGIVGAALAGWASDNKYSLLGGMRAASQMVSYEVTLGLTLMGAILVYGTVRVDEMVLWQAENSWGIFVQPLAFVLFLAAAIAETKRGPFDLPEGESEIVAGYFTEYGGMKFTMFFFSEYISMVASSVVMASLWLGGWHLPFFTADGIRVVVGETVLYSTLVSAGWLTVLGMLGFVGKVLLLCWLQIAIRWTLPRFRYDQLMRLGWRKLLPASLVNLMVTAVVVLAIQLSSAQVQATVALLAQLSMLLLAVLGLAAPVALVVFLMIPSQKQRLVVSTATRYAAAVGGTRAAKMEA